MTKIKNNKNEYDLVKPYDDKYAEIKQATKQGYILCEWGGGGGFNLSFF